MDKDKCAETVEAIVRVISNMVTDTVERSVGGVAFIVGDSKKVLSLSVSKSPEDPILAIPRDLRSIWSPEFARWLYTHVRNIDGAIIVDEDGYIHATGRYLPIDFSFLATDGISDYISRHQLGGRHLSAITITNQTNAIAVVASEELSIRIFHSGRPIKHLKPFVGLVSYEEDITPPDSRLGRMVVERIGSKVYTPRKLDGSGDMPRPGAPSKDRVTIPDNPRVVWDDPENKNDKRNDVMFM